MPGSCIGQRPDCSRSGDARVAGQLIVLLENDFFPRYAMVGYESDVRVLRREKF
jgi:hypothetical protein